MFNVSFQGSLFPFTEDSATCVFKDNSPIKHSPSLGWDQHFSAYHAIFQIVTFFRKGGQVVVSLAFKTLKSVLSLRG